MLRPYFFMDRFGRRTLLIWSSAACSFCMIMISSMLAVDTLVTQWVFVAFCFIFFDVFSWGILPVSWMYASEIMPLRTRNKGVALGVSTHWLSNFVVVYVTPQAIENLGYKLYIIWAVFNASFVPIVWFFYPEVSEHTIDCFSGPPTHTPLRLQDALSKKSTTSSWKRNLDILPKLVSLQPRELVALSPQWRVMRSCLMRAKRRRLT